MEITQPTIDLSEQVAIVTGGGRGFGREIARALARLGARVAVIARTAEQLAETVALIQSDGSKAVAISADVTNISSVYAMVEQVERELGAVDLLINNAGRLTTIGPVWEVDPNEWWRDVEVNLRGTFLCCHAVLKKMIPRQHGRIINFTSAAMPYLTAYDCSKVAVTRLTHFLAQETKAHGISVFAITVGPTHTDMMDYLLESEAGRKYLPDLAKWLEGSWQPLEWGGMLATALASGRYDRLTGRWIGAKDNLEEMMRRIEEIQQDELYVWSFRLLKSEELQR
jgi:NAD(P)-dependent dehydrogenase (short-subunit alcohol dehydrogenase family)